MPIQRCGNEDGHGGRRSGCVVLREEVAAGLMIDWRRFFRLLAAAAAMMAGCAHYPPLIKTPKHKIAVHVRADVPVDGLTVLMWVDLRADEWLRNRAAWGCEDKQDFELGIALHSEPVIIHGEQVIWNGELWCLGYNQYTGDDPQIHVTINNPPLLSSDPLYNGDGIGIVAFDYSYGLRQLPHEWTHTARGNWHP